jgi:hypothetical protein
MEYFSAIINLLANLAKLARTLFTDAMHFIALLARSRTALAAENLFLRKQLAFYQERKVRPRRFDNVTRLMLVLLSLGFAWKDALVNVTPKTFIGWHRAEFRLSLAKYRVSFAQASRGHLNLLRGAGPLRGRRLPGNTISARVSAAGVGEDAKTGQLFVN